MTPKDDLKKIANYIKKNEIPVKPITPLEQTPVRSKTPLEQTPERPTTAMFKTEKQQGRRVIDTSVPRKKHPN